MSVAEKLCSYRGLVTVDNSIVVSAPNFQTVSVAGRYVTYNVDLFPAELGRL